MSKLAVVTGATGVVGLEIVNLLLNKGLRVRVLTRNKSFTNNSLEIHYGSIEDADVARLLVADADCLFHCAGELHDESKMWSTNVEGTKVLFEAAKNSNISYICHLSSVGVIGKIDGNYANESTLCSPMNTYEKSKLAGEQVVMGVNFVGKSIVILRPTNVVTSKKNNIIGLSKFKVFLKGGERSHIIHGKDVAAAAVYFLDHPVSKTECFIVSCDEEKLNSLAGCFALHEGLKENLPMHKIKPFPHLSWKIIYFIRRLLKGPCNRGDVCYSSQKLISSGFQYPLGFMGAIKDISENSQC